MLKLFFSLLFSLQAHAISFESFPEFITLTEDEQSALDSATAIDTKYSAAAMSYQKPPTWHWQWLKANKFFDLSIGSIDGTRFLIDNRLKLYAFLNDNLEFRFTYFQEQNLETNYLAHNLELIYWMNKNFGISLYGELFFQKRKNDAGVAFFYKPEDTHEIKYFFTLVDFTRNDRNDQTDYFTQTPYATGLVGRLWNQENPEFFEYAITFETPTNWVFPSSGYEYKYWRKLASLFYKASNFEARVEFTQKYEAKSNVGSVKTDRLLSYLRKPLHLSSTWIISPGIAAAHRHWELDSGPSNLTEFIPHVILDNGKWNFEYDLTLHNAGSEHRLATIYNIAFSDKSNLRIVATWDLANLFKNKPWGGGNAQFNIIF